MKKCPNCGYEMADDDKFCMGCGMQADGVPQDAASDDKIDAGRSPEPRKRINNGDFLERHGRKLIIAAGAMVAAAAIYAFVVPPVGGRDYKRGVESLKSSDYAAAEASFQKGVNDGDVKAMVALADLYIDLYKKRQTEGAALARQGIDVSELLTTPNGNPVDAGEITRLYSAAIEKGSPEAMLALGNFKLGKNKGMDNKSITDIQGAREWIGKAVEKGYGGSGTMCRLAYAYTLSDGNTEADLDEAEKWYRDAADQGDAKTLYELADFLRTRYAADKNKREEWIALLEKSAGLGYAEAAYDLGDEYNRNFVYVKNASFESIPADQKEALKWYKKAADMGYTPAFVQVGIMYIYGEGVEANANTGMSWLKKGADTGDAHAVNRIARLYENGELGEKDYQEAIRWYQRAAELGYIYAPYSIGYLYEVGGHGVGKDLESAMKWYKRGAEQGDDNAKCSIGEMYYKGKGVKKDYAEAMKWFKEASKGEPSIAQFYVAEMYRKGLGTDKDYQKSIEWYHMTPMGDSELEEGPKSIADLPFFAVLYSQTLNFPDYPASEGYACAEVALSRFFDNGESTWTCIDALNIYTPLGIRKFWGWVSASELNKRGGDAQRINRCLKDDSSTFSDACGFPIMLMAQVNCTGVGENVYDPTEKARYELVIFIKFGSKYGFEYEYLVRMNGQEIPAGDLLSAVYLNND